uniref:Transcription factor CBF/NF-Y/archaeal histone domain-containing protein n=1 Tax=Chenopodium quinoa TaxID=63459 RepID=A0A803L177_CHEQI
MAEEEENPSPETLKPSFPTGRVKKIVKFDKDITRITSEALFLVSGATELFLHFLAEKSAEIAVEKKRKNIKLDYLRLAVKRHHPTRDFLLDSLPLPSSQPLDDPPADRTVKGKSVLPPNTRHG